MLALDLYPFYPPDPAVRRFRFRFSSLSSLSSSLSSSLLFSSLLFAISIFPEISLKREIYSLTLFVINFHVEGESIDDFLEVHWFRGLGFEGKLKED